MIKILIPEINKKTKTDVRGLWLNDNHKLFYDYLRQDVLLWDLDRPNYKIRFYNYLDRIKTQYRQEAIFYYYNGKGFIYYNRDKIEVLNKHKTFMIKDNLLYWHNKNLIKRLLAKYNGLTIYKEIGYYLIEVYYNQEGLK